MLPSGVLLLTLDRIDANSLQATPLWGIFFRLVWQFVGIHLYSSEKAKAISCEREVYCSKTQWDNDLASVQTRELLDPWIIWSLHPCSIMFNDVKFTGFIFSQWQYNDITLFRLVAETFPNVHLHFKHKLLSANLEEGHLVLSWYDKKLVFFLGLYDAVN